MNVEEFICPECGSHETGGKTHVSTVPDERDPWSGVLVRIRCASCRAVIPAHLAERWDNVSLEEARKQWREIYRDSQPSR